MRNQCLHFNFNKKQSKRQVSPLPSIQIKIGAQLPQIRPLIHWNQYYNYKCSGEAISYIVFDFTNKSKANNSPQKPPSPCCWQRCPNPEYNSNQLLALLLHLISLPPCLGWNMMGWIFIVGLGFDGPRGKVGEKQSGKRLVSPFLVWLTLQLAARNSFWEGGTSAPAPSPSTSLW